MGNGRKYNGSADMMVLRVDQMKIDVTLFTKYYLRYIVPCTYLLSTGIIISLQLYISLLTSQNLNVLFTLGNNNVKDGNNSCNIHNLIEFDIYLCNRLKDNLCTHILGILDLLSVIERLWGLMWF